jgi:hypothetical protein
VVLSGKTLSNELTASSIKGGITTFTPMHKTNSENNKETKQTIIKQCGIAPEEYGPA